MTPRLSKTSRVWRRLMAPIAALAAPTMPASAGAPLGQAAHQAPHAAGGDAANTWAPTGSMSVSRSGQTATLLPDGMVLVAGGGTATAELFDPATGSFSPTGSMSTARTDATATLLPDGDVLVAGGCCDRKAQLKSAELYDPDSGTWSLTGSMNVARSSQVAVLLPDGKVLVAGGGCNGHGFGCDAGSYLGTLKSAELYDPTSGSWARTGTMAHGREFFTASLLTDGTVLVTGGFTDCDDSFCVDLASAERYDPATGHWSATGSMRRAREQHTATVLRDGRVLVAGGIKEPGGGGRGRPLAEAEIYDPSSGTWSPVASMARPHYGGTATLLSNGWVLVAGGATRADQLYQPVRGVWVTPGLMSTTRTDQTATVLADGHVLVTGGLGPDGRPQPTAEVYLAGKGPLVALEPAALGFRSQWVGTRSAPLAFTVANLGTGDLDVSGVSVSGANPGDFTVTTTCTDAHIPPSGTCDVSVTFSPSATGSRTADVGLVDDAPRTPQHDPVTGFGNGPDVWVPTGSLSGPRDEATATLLENGGVLIAGGENGPLNMLDSVQIYNPVTGRFIPTGPLNVARAYATAIRLRNGQVLVAGGIGSNQLHLSSAEVYDPETLDWSMTGDMHQAGYAMTSTLLASGKVLVTGLGYPDTAELYNPATGTWADTGPMLGNGIFSTATLLGDGQVLVAGGGTADAELYDPGSNSWTATGSMNASRLHATATRVPGGQVLVAGGDDPNGVPLASSELYDPSTGIWTPTTGSMRYPRVGHTATLLPNGWVVVTGGCTAECDRRNVTDTSEAFDIHSGYWFPLPSSVQGRFAATATLLPDGSLLLAGGSNYCCTSFDSAEVFTASLLRDKPERGPVGQQVTLRGSGFYAFEDVRISWDGGPPLGNARTGRGGSFVTEVTVPSANPGAHTFVANGKTSFARAQAAFTVTGSG